MINYGKALEWFSMILTLSQVCAVSSGKREKALLFAWAQDKKAFIGVYPITDKFFLNRKSFFMKQGELVTGDFNEGNLQLKKPSGEFFIDGHIFYGKMIIFEIMDDSGKIDLDDMFELHFTASKFYEMEVSPIPDDLRELPGIAPVYIFHNVAEENHITVSGKNHIRNLKDNWVAWHELGIDFFAIPNFLSEK